MTCGKALGHQLSQLVINPPEELQTLIIKA